MRLVLDTNVVVSALLWGGAPYRLIEAAAAGDIELATSPALLAELREMLERSHLASRLVAQRSSVEQAIALYGEMTVQVSPLDTPRVVAGDVDDDQVIAAAVAAQADLIVTGDRRHLLPIGNHQGIPIVTAREALQRLGA